jgi:hypothetical protein
LKASQPLARLDAFTRGAIEVQDEGSQLLALLLDAKRGEMVVDFCAGAGGKTLAIGAACATRAGFMRLTLRRTGWMRSNRGWRAAAVQCASGRHCP